MSFMVATRKADGKLPVECVTGDVTDHAAADRAVADHANQSPQPAQAARETK
jgi:hypothetical protein